jgi:hypothetical protein
MIALDGYIDFHGQSSWGLNEGAKAQGVEIAQAQG